MFIAALLALAGTSALLSTPARADFQNRRIALINHSHMTIREFHASNVSARDFEEDILGRSVVPPGHSVEVNLNDGTGYCRFDFLTVMDNGVKIIRRNVDVCSLDDYTIND
jgi:hypothetical protein